MGEIQRSQLRLLGEDIILVVNSEPGLRPVFMVDARASMAHGGRLTITLGNTDVRDATGTIGENRLAPGPYVAIEVMDTGSGTDASVLPHIFEPFFTTKGGWQGHRPGSRLRVWHRDAEPRRHLGHQRGRTRQHLPRPLPCRRGVHSIARDHVSGGRPARRRRGQAARRGRNPGRGGRESSVRRYVCEVLRGRGYIVLQACNGIEGIAVARRRGRSTCCSPTS